MSDFFRLDKMESALYIIEIFTETTEQETFVRHISDLCTMFPGLRQEETENDIYQLLGINRNPRSTDHPFFLHDASSFVRIAFRRGKP